MELEAGLLAEMYGTFKGHSGKRGLDGTFTFRKSSVNVQTPVNIPTCSSGKAFAFDPKRSRLVLGLWICQRLDASVSGSASGRLAPQRLSCTEGFIKIFLAIN